MISDSNETPIQLVTEADAEEFFKLIERTLQDMDLEKRSRAYLLASRRQAVVISINIAGQPFIGFNKGENPPNQRTYLSAELTDSKVLAIVIEDLAMGNIETAGGRVFISKEKAYRVIKDQEYVICVWDWQGDDPYGRVGLILRNIT